MHFFILINAIITDLSGKNSLKTKNSVPILSRSTLQLNRTIKEIFSTCRSEKRWEMILIEIFRGDLSTLGKRRESGTWKRCRTPPTDFPVCPFHSTSLNLFMEKRNFHLKRESESRISNVHIYMKIIYFLTLCGSSSHYKLLSKRT